MAEAVEITVDDLKKHLTPDLTLGRLNEGVTDVDRILEEVVYEFCGHSWPEWDQILRRPSHTDALIASGLVGQDHGLGGDPMAATIEEAYSDNHIRAMARDALNTQYAYLRG